MNPPGTTNNYAFGGAVLAMKEGVMASVTRTLTYLHGDHLGSASLTTNASGQKVSEQRYKPYGEVRWSSGAGLPTDFTFTGQRAGPANYVGSLMDYVARGYSPALGRFISADTIVPGAGNPAAFNRYMYVLGNPLGLRDPSGHAGCQGCVNLDFLQAIASFFEGFGHRLSDNSSFGAVTALEVARDAYPSPENTDSYRDGESAADLVSAAQGIAEIVGGGGTLIGAAVGGTVCVGLSSGGCLAIAVPAAPAVVAAAGASVVHGSAMLAKVANGPQHGKIVPPGSAGVQTTSKTLYNKDGVRIDVENPSPSKRPGQVHVQVGKEKYIYDPSTGQFRDAPKRIQSLLADEDIQDAVRKGVQKYLGIQEWKP